MATQYDLSNFTPMVIPSGYNRDIKGLVAAAVSLGWTLHVTAGTALRLVAKDGKVIQLNLGKKSHPIEQYKRLIKTHANPLLRPVDDPELGSKRASQAAKAIEMRFNTQAVEAMGTNGYVEAVKVAHEINDANTVVYEGPMRSTRVTSSGKNKTTVTYDSEIATEVAYADGRRVFTCVKCDFSREVPLAMSAHWQKHSAPKPKPEPVVEPVVEVTPKDPAMLALKEMFMGVMQQGINWGDLDGAAETLAESVLVWQEANGPMTDSEDILNQIRALVGLGKNPAQEAEIDALKRQLEQYAEHLEQADARLLELESERDKARDNLSALKDLLNGVE